MAAPKAAVRRQLYGRFLIALCGLALALFMAREPVVGVTPARAEDAPASAGTSASGCHCARGKGRRHTRNSRG